MLTTERKLLIGGGVLCILLLLGSYWFVTRQDTKSKTALEGVEIPVTGNNHLPVGTKIDYNSNPPAAGPHYDETAHAGFYDKPTADGHIVHSLEHGAVVLWYKADLPKDQIAKLKNIFDQTRGKTLMMPRKNMDVPVALTSWARMLKLKTIDEKTILKFFESNLDRAPEQAPI